MAEKTPVIVLTVVLVVGIMGFATLYSAANTGMFNVYGRAIAQEKAGELRNREVLDDRTVYAPYMMGTSGVKQADVAKEYGQDVDPELITQEGATAGNTGGIITTGKAYNQRVAPLRYVDKKDGCYIRGIPELQGFMGQFRPAWEATKTARTTEVCFAPGQQVAEGYVTVTPAVMPQNREYMYPWGAEDTVCCIVPPGRQSTY